MFAKWLPRIADFLLHSVLAIPVAMILGLIPEALASSIYHNTFLEPFTPMIVLTAVILAVLSSKWIRSSVARWVWTLPSAWFLYGFYDATRYWSPVWDSSSSKWSHAFKELLTTQCGSSECLGELFFTTPLVCSVVYSLAYLIILKFPGNRRFYWKDVWKSIRSISRVP